MAHIAQEQEKRLGGRRQPPTKPHQGWDFYFNLAALAWSLARGPRVPVQSGTVCRIVEKKNGKALTRPNEDGVVKG